jgi:hypothetical protein
MERIFKYRIPLQGSVQNITEDEDWSFPIHVAGKG